jgi:hypothetical protein
MVIFDHNHFHLDADEPIEQSYQQLTKKKSNIEECRSLIHFYQRKKIVID